ncbi:hypothetical protein BQ8794_60127 [Mesorhizobium prunaredense]|uniref:Uncharacterized protein n=1 Tax=Mesorhizobium prunaredense TaxID=1631249 RepID=A0A1R3VG48_9HYPH|nr:hypothetical protein BQ8794_60127 [Mesorhizobium prunaredense]
MPGLPSWSVGPKENEDRALVRRLQPVSKLQARSVLRQAKAKQIASGAVTYSSVVLVAADTAPTAS